MGFDRLLCIVRPYTLGQYTACYNRLCFNRIAKIIRFKKDILEYVKDNLTIQQSKMWQIASLYSAFNTDN